MGTSRSRLSAALVAVATLASGLVVGLGAAPAQAGWTDVGAMTRYRICKEALSSAGPSAGPSGQGWTFLSRARKPARTEDARAGVVLRVDGERGQRWSSGWLRDHEVDRGWVRHRGSGRIRVHVWQEAGDRDSGIGTAREREVLRPRQIRRCG